MVVVVVVVVVVACVFTLLPVICVVGEGVARVSLVHLAHDAARVFVGKFHGES